MGPHHSNKVDAMAAGARWFFTGEPCKNGHLAPRSARDGKCAICTWLSWERVRRSKGKEPFNPNEARWDAKARGDRYFQGEPCPNGHNGTRWTHNAACVECTVNAARDFHKSEAGKEYSRRWRIENAEKVRETNRNAKARRKGAEGTHTAKDIREILARQKYKCAECGTSVRKRANRHIDHIMPLGLGGTNWAWNLQVLCPPCNLSKNAKHPIEWAQSKGRLL